MTGKSGFALFISPRRGLRTGRDAGDIRVFVTRATGRVGAQRLGARPAIVFLLALFLPGAFFGALFEGGFGPIRHFEASIEYILARRLRIPEPRARGAGTRRALRCGRYHALGAPQRRTRDKMPDSPAGRSIRNR